MRFLLLTIVAIGQSVAAADWISLATSNEISGDLHITGNLFTSNIVASGSVPVITVNTSSSTGLNVGGTATLVSGTVLSGRVAISTPALAQPSAPYFFTNTFPTALAKAPVVILSGYDTPNANAVGGSFRSFFVIPSTTNFIVGYGSSFSQSSTFNVGYLVIQQP